MRKSKPKFPRDPAQIARFAVASAVAEVVDSAAVPIDRLGYRPTWSESGRDRIIEREQEKIAVQNRAKMRKAGPELKKVIAIWRGSKFGVEERRAAFAQAEILAAKVGLTIEQAVALDGDKRI